MSDLTVLETKTYSGQGLMMISELGTEGNPIGYLNLGRATSVEVVVKQDSLVHKSGQEGIETVDLVVHKDPIAEVTVKGVETDPEVIAELTGGFVETTPEDSFEEVTSSPVIPGRVYPLTYVGSDTLVVTNEAGTVTYEDGVQYDIYGSGNSVRVYTLEEQAAKGAIDTIDSIKLKFSYNVPEQTKIITRFIPFEPMALRFEGLNTANNNDPVVVTFPEVNPQFLKKLALVAGKTSGWEFTSSVIGQKQNDGSFVYYHTQTLS
ncbi:MAG: hypothetical protein GWN00_01400 [Aliifodinibius sp.]|nr:hypothetical protein [Phycisphaerae bacterium]NIR62336.1 hypothetical protein [candidate division Zixibacteria bacterium]NIT54934.1 hypothetical protein [Fodinibius sp.]NIW43348.1 hypothetical protein [Gammaproteobacteria bacterium]NIU12569.1 hypothetical protein [candidate division Zixibacteria bacterium]